MLNECKQIHSTQMLPFTACVSQCFSIEIFYILKNILPTE